MITRLSIGVKCTVNIALINHLKDSSTTSLPTHWLSSILFNNELNPSGNPEMVLVGIADGIDDVTHWLADINLQSLEHSLITMAVSGVYSGTSLKGHP